MPSISELLAKARAKQAQAQAKQDKTAPVTQYGIAAVAKATARADKVALKTAAEGKLDSTGILQVQDLDAITLDDSQAKALETISQHKMVALTGAAGTGKTTVLRAFVKKNPPTFKWQHIRVGEVTDTLFLSLTGKAVAQMRLVLPKEYAASCMTIHSALAVYPEKQEDGRLRYVPRYHQGNKLECKRVFIDEATMCSVQLWNMLREALPDDCKVCFIGDINQLPPVAGRPILAYALIAFPYAALETIHRQAEESPVLSACHKILRGEPIDTTRGMVIRQCPNDPVDASYEIVKRIIALYHNGQYKPMEDQIITAGNTDALGQEELNARLLPHLTREGNPMHKVFYARRFRTFAVGTKVMYTENDYELGIFNGLQGVVESIEPNPLADPDIEFESIGFGRPLTVEDVQNLDDLTDYKRSEELGVTGKEVLDEEDAGRQASHVVTVLFNDGTRVKLFRSSQIANLQVAFVCTCHKMQGSECRKAIIICHKSQALLHSREWLYTAISRAKEAAMIFTSTTISKRKLTHHNDGDITQTLANKASLNTSIQQCIDSPRILGRSAAEKIKTYIRTVMANKEEEQPHWLPDLEG